MNDEPVAWMYTSKDEEGEWKMFVEEEPSWVENAIPLYTRPSKQLSDEEIMKISGGENLSEQVFFWSRDAVLGFARAIIREMNK